jgi:vacuolar-type H+-ATPase subunit E/Vma4
MTRDSQITRAQALVDRIEAETKAETDRILGAAEAEAALVLRAARERARKRVAAEIVRLRREHRDAVQRVDAQHDTQRRQLKQREAGAIIEAGLPAVRDALAGLWAEAETRRGWIMALVARAEAQFGQAKWCVEHGRHWADVDIEALVAAVQRASGQRPDIREDPAIEAGLRLRKGNAVLDGSLGALIGDRKETGAALLALIAETKGNGHE